MGSGVPRGTRRRVLARDGCRCVECGGAELLTVHHIVARNDGGSNHAGNLTTLCLRCHDKQHGVRRPNHYRAEARRVAAARGL